MTYTYNLRNRRNKADYHVAKLNTQKSDIGLRSQERDIRVEVRQAARKNVELQLETLNAEQKKLDNGMSTGFELLEVQKDLAQAELDQIQAALAYVKSLTALELSKGTLLEARGLTLGP